MDIDWDVVNKNLTCPMCGERAFIRPGTDGTEGFHEHYFAISRAHAQELTRKFGKPSYADLERRIAELEEQMRAQTAHSAPR